MNRHASCPNPAPPITNNSPNTVDQARRVSFSSSPSLMSTPRSRAGEDPSRPRGDSPADEITPIAGREWGAVRGYNTVLKADSEARRGGGGRRKKSIRDNGTANQGGEEDAEPEGRWKHFMEKYGSVEIDNKGSAARDHLALERTFLAWLRTSLAFASIGIAITQLFRLNTTISRREGLVPIDENTTHLRQVGKPLGATFLGIAILVLFIGGRRYFESQYWIIRGKFPASRGSVFLITFVALALIVSSLVVVCVVDPTLFEKK